MFVSVSSFFCHQTSFRRWDNHLGYCISWNDDLLCNTYYSSILQLFFRCFNGKRFQQCDKLLRLGKDRDWFRVECYDFLSIRNVPLMHPSRSLLASKTCTAKFLITPNHVQTFKSPIWMNSGITPMTFIYSFAGVWSLGLWNFLILFFHWVLK